MGNWQEHQQERHDAFNESAFRRCEAEWLDPPEDDPIACNRCGNEIKGKYTELFEDFYCMDCIGILLVEGERNT